MTRRADIEETARVCLLEFWDGVMPIAPRQIAKGMKLEVREDTDLSYENLSGKYEEGVVYFNPNHSSNRSRFTLAHEIGHHVLGHGDALRSDNPESTPQEIEANQFAAALIMPRKLILKRVEKGMTSLTDLARDFGVSELAMHIRLKDLGFVRG